MIESALLFSIIACIVLIIVLKEKYSKIEVSKPLSMLFIGLVVWCIGLLLQRISLNFNFSINPIYFDYLTYIGICFVPPMAVVMSLIYAGKERSKIRIFSLFVVPLLSLLILWTNDLHNLFYEVYSVNFNDTIYGIMFYVNTAYSYIMIAIFIVIMVKFTIKKSGFFSIQAGLIILGSAIPLIINVLGTMKIISMTIYVTPIMFLGTVICYAFAIIKYKALNITPIAFRTVINTMSDSFVVISNDRNYS